VNNLVYKPARWPTTAWFLISKLELAALPAAAGSARKHARAVALEFGLSALADTIELIVSEIVTNALLATRDLLPAVSQRRLSGCHLNLICAES
jgi:anti-sigma regulatory factor (Ser/Thr protein kinase)